MYRHDMSEENVKKLIPEGVRQMQITKCVESKSKAGNDMFIITFLDLELFETLDVYAIATPKKRWFLKSVLDACGIAAAQDGIYEWEIEDIIDQNVLAKVKHEPDSWVNQKGETVETVKAKIIAVDNPGAKPAGLDTEILF